MERVSPRVSHHGVVCSRNVARLGSAFKSVYNESVRISQPYKCLVSPVQSTAVSDDFCNMFYCCRGNKFLTCQKRFLTSLLQKQTGSESSVRQLRTVTDDEELKRLKKTEENYLSSSL